MLTSVVLHIRKFPSLLLNSQAYNLDESHTGTSCQSSNLFAPQSAEGEEVLSLGVVVVVVVFFYAPFPSFFTVVSLHICNLCTNVFIEHIHAAHAYLQETSSSYIN